MQVMLYNSQAWSKLTKQDIKSLQTVQLKYIKRVFHVPASTPNAVTFLETGFLPIEQEINIRQLNYLHHILTLDKQDPVRMVYVEQLKYSFESNWGNEVRDFREKYRIKQHDDEIAKMTRGAWKRIVKKAVKKYTLDLLNNELSKLKIGKCISQYQRFKQQKYMNFLSPAHARKLFQVRTGVIDLKANRQYWYDDVACRLCSEEEENVEHVVNRCNMVARTYVVMDVYSSVHEDDMKEIAGRCVEFTNKIDEMNST